MPTPTAFVPRLPRFVPLSYLKLGVAGVDVRDPVHVAGVEFGDDAAGTNGRFVDHPLVLSPESVDSLGAVVTTVAKPLAEMSPKLETKGCGGVYPRVLRLVAAISKGGEL